MATSRRTKDPHGRTHFWVVCLALFGILSVMVAMVAAFAPTVFSKLTGQAARSPQKPTGGRIETVEVVPANDTSVVRERYSVRLAPSHPSKPESAGAPSTGQRNSPSIEKIAVPTAPDQSTPSAAQATPSAALISTLEVPFGNEQSTAREFDALRKALLQDDAIQISIALNDFTNLPDDLEPLVKRLANLWIQRHDVMNAVIPTLKTALKVKDPLTGESGAIVSGSRSSATIGTGIGSHVVAWGRWSNRDIADMWISFAERSDYHADIVLCAATANWLVGDLIRCRMLAKTWITRSPNTDAHTANSLLQLQTSIERWNGLLCWERAQTALEQGDAAEQARCVIEMKALQQLGSPWLAPMVAKLSVSVSADRGANAQKRGAGTQIPSSAVALPQFADARLTGSWESTAKGARFPRDGAIEIDTTPDASALCLVITPENLQGVIRISAAPNEIILDLNRAALLIKNSSVAPQSTPITVYPRYENKITVRFGATQSLGSLVINHDQQILLTPPNWRPKKVAITAPQESGFLLNAITLER